MPVLLLLIPFLAAGCQVQDEPETPGTLADAQVEVSGTLRSGMMAIGAETTGYELELPADERIEVDLSGIDDADRHVDRPVRIQGRLEQRDYVERGPTPVLVATEIRPADGATGGGALQP